jgi:hypothetical protein
MRKDLADDEDALADVLRTSLAAAAAVLTGATIPRGRARSPLSACNGADVSRTVPRPLPRPEPRGAGRQTGAADAP